MSATWTPDAGFVDGLYNMDLRFQGVTPIHWTRNFEGAIANLETRVSSIEEILV